VRKTEKKSSTGRPRCRWKDNIEIKEIGREDVAWIDLAQDTDRLQAAVNKMMNL
jgi:hypothetical protein